MDYIGLVGKYNPIITNNQGILPEEYHQDNDDSRLSMEYEFDQNYIDDWNRIKDELDYNCHD